MNSWTIFSSSARTGPASAKYPVSMPQQWSVSVFYSNSSGHQVCVSNFGFFASQDRVDSAALSQVVQVNPNRIQAMENPPNASDSASTSSEPRTPSSGSSGSDRGSPSTERYHPYGEEKRKKAKTTAKPTKTNRKIWPCAHEKALFDIWELYELVATSVHSLTPI